MEIIYSIVFHNFFYRLFHVVCRLAQCLILLFTLSSIFFTLHNFHNNRINIVQSGPHNSENKSRKHNNRYGQLKRLMYFSTIGRWSNNNLEELPEIVQTTVK